MPPAGFNIQTPDGETVTDGLISPMPAHTLARESHLVSRLLPGAPNPVKFASNTCSIVGWLHTPGNVETDSQHGFCFVIGPDSPRLDSRREDSWKVL